MMRRTVIAAVLSVGMIAVGVAQAGAASTRTEYIAQVDPICQSFVGSINDARTAYNKNHKRWGRDLNHGSLKRWERQTHRTFQSLGTLVQIEAALTDQIAAVPPAAEDAATINAWLTGRNKAERFGYSAALAFDSFKFDLFGKRLNQSNRAFATGIKAIFGFGFQTCGVIV
jgi:sensor domain CHASE-containing protein